MKELTTKLLIAIVLAAMVCFAAIAPDHPHPGQSEIRGMRVILTGDLMCQYKQQKDAFDGKKYDFNYAFDYVRGILEEGDLVIGNLETNISPSSPLGAEQERKYDQPYLNAPVQFLEALKNAGFNVLVNANNHNCDTGVKGLNETIKEQKKYGFQHTGIFSDSAEKRYLILESKGIKIGLSSYAVYFNNSIQDFSQSEQALHLNGYSEEKVRKDVKAMKEDGADYIITYLHCGTEYSYEPNVRQLKYAQEIADSGSDYIICSHSHTVQPYKILRAKSGKKVPVSYSSGNFISHMTSRRCRQAMITELLLLKKDGKVSLAKSGYYPCLVMKRNSESGKKYQVIPCTRDGISHFKEKKNLRRINASRRKMIRIVGRAIHPIK